MTIILGVALRIDESKLSKCDKVGFLSQMNLVSAHETLSRSTFNWVVAFYSRYIELRGEHINSKLLALCDDDEIRLKAFNKAAKWVTVKAKNSNFIFPENDKPYKTLPTDAAAEKAKTDKDKRELQVDEVVITASEAKKYHETRQKLYAEFEKEFGNAFDLFRNSTLESVLSQLNHSCQDQALWFDGKTLYDRYFTTVVPPKDNKPGFTQLRKVLPAWAIEFLVEQEVAHPCPKYDKDRLQVPLYLNDSETPTYYPAHRRVMVQEIKNAAAAVSKHLSRFFQGGNPNQGMPTFRKFKDDQTFELSKPNAAIFVYEKPNFAKHLPEKIAAYQSENGKLPNKQIQKSWEKKYIEDWEKENPTPNLNSVSSIIVPELGKVRVDSHGVRRMHELLHPKPAKNYVTGEVTTSGGKMLTNVRVSRKAGNLSVSFSIRMPANWHRERPDSYYLSEDKKIGVDMGIIDSAILSTGYSFSNVSRNSRHKDHVSAEPRTKQEQAFKKAMEHEDKAYSRVRALEDTVKKLQVKASSIYDQKLKEKGGNKKEARAILPKSWHGLQQEIRKNQNTITNIRTHHRNVIAKTIVANFDFVGIEDLNIKGLISKNYSKTDDLGNFLPNGQSAKRGMNKAMSAVGLGEILSLIQQKAAFYNTEVQKINRWFASSLLCSNCGEKKEKKDLSLSIREYNCKHCNFSIGRDHNAAINILKSAQNLANGETIPGEHIISFEAEMKEIEEIAAQSDTEE